MAKRIQPITAAQLFELAERADDLSMDLSAAVDQMQKAWADDIEYPLDLILKLNRNAESSLALIRLIGATAKMREHFVRAHAKAAGDARKGS